MKQLVVVTALFLACRQNPASEVRTATSTPQPPPVADTMTGTAVAPPVDTAVATGTTTSAPPLVPAETAPPGVRGPKLMPVDEAPRDPELAAFRESLLSAVRARNIEAILLMSDPGIRTTFGAGGGTADFRRMLNEPGMLGELEQVLTLGGSFRGEGASLSFWAPYVYSAWPDAHDPWESLAVVSENVPLLPAPDPTTAPVALLSFDIVERVSPPQPLAAGATPPPYIQIFTADERSGWVASKSVRSHVAYRTGFTKVDGKWRMNAFVAGD